MPEQMIRILDCLKINKAPGPDGIHPGILKKEGWGGGRKEIFRTIGQGKDGEQWQCERSIQIIPGNERRLGN